ncbi:MAG: superfamily II helicase [Dasosvirus sp.]|uniref:Replication origin-binding protein n=1 Tax=Dasosvirus sp. TaxID=2487764 RepID=A0A3G4ZRD1_9VIRU|nr:MAG: superfamily II helicase [Dasosvirus sp.]
MDILIAKNIFEDPIDGIKWSYKINQVEKFPIILSQAYNGTYRFVGFNHWSHAVFKLIKSGKSIYEDYLVCKPYIDYDNYIDLDKYIANKSSYEKDSLEILYALYQSINNAMRKLVSDSDFEILIAKSHGEVERNGKKCYKISFHFVINSVYRFRSSMDAIQLANMIRKDSHEPEITNAIDLNVYKKSEISYQKFRCVYSSKTRTDRRILEPIDLQGNVLKDVNISDYLVSHNTKDIIMLPNLEMTEEDSKNEVEEMKTNKSQKKNSAGNTYSAIQRIMLDILRKYIYTACLDFDIKTNSVKGTTSCSFNYDHKQNKCIYENGTHDHIGGYIMIINGSSIYAGCYSTKCKRRKPKFLGNILDESYWIKNNDHITINSKYLMKNTRAKKLINKFAQKDGNKILCIKSSIGSGKTYALEQIIENHVKVFGEESRILCVSTRRGYAQDIQNNTLSKFKFTNYMKVKGDLKNEKRLIISLESFFRICTNGYLREYDLIILDEVESILGQFFSSTVEKKENCFEKFVEFLDKAHKVVMMDADLNNRGMEFAKFVSNRITTIYNRYGGIKKKYILTNDYEKYYDSMKKDILEGKNIAVASLCKTMALHLRDRLRQDFPEISDFIVCLHSDCSSTLREELENIKESWRKYRVLLFTTIVGVGLNFDIRNYFYKIYGYVAGGLEAPRSFLQMLGRIRHPIDHNVTILMAKSMNKKLNQQLYSFEYANKFHSSIIEKDYRSNLEYMYDDENNCGITRHKAKDTMFNRLRAYFIQEKELNNMSSNFLTMLKIDIETRGHEFILDLTDGPMKNIEIKKMIDRIIEARNLSNYEYTELITINNITEEENLSITKVQMRRELNLKPNISEDKLSEFLRSYYNRIVMIDLIRFRYTKNQRKYYFNNDNIRTRFIGTNDLFNRVVDNLHCDFVKDMRDANYVMTYEAEEFETILEKMKFSSKDVEMIETRGKIDNKYELIKSLLSRFGLILRAPSIKKRVNGKRKRFRTYEIYYDEEIYSLVKCRIHNERQNYIDCFVTFVKSCNYIDSCFLVRGKLFI